MRDDLKGRSADFGAAPSLITRLWRAMDVARHDEVLGLLAADCRWFREGGWQEGTAAIRASLDRRPTGRTVRHLLSNFIVDCYGDMARCAYYLLAYEAEGEPTSTPRPLGPAFAMADMTTTVTLVEDALRIREIGMDVTFLRTTA